MKNEQNDSIINLHEQHGRISPIREAKLNVAKIFEKSVIPACSLRYVQLIQHHSHSLSMSYYLGQSFQEWTK